MKIKKQKPIETSVSLKYICPNNNCGFDHWLFLNEAKTKNFKIVCECGTIFKPKRIKNIEIVYDIPESVKKSLDEQSTSDTIPKDADVVCRAINMMISLGYGRKDSENVIKLIYNKDNTPDASVLVKKAVKHIGGIE